LSKCKNIAGQQKLIVWYVEQPLEVYDLANGKIQKALKEPFV